MGRIDELYTFWEIVDNYNYPGFTADLLQLLEQIYHPEHARSRLRYLGTWCVANNVVTREII